MSPYEVVWNDEKLFAVRLKPSHLRCAIFRKLGTKPTHGVIVNAAHTFLGLPVGKFKFKGKSPLHWPTRRAKRYLAINSDGMRLTKHDTIHEYDDHAIAPINQLLVWNGEIQDAVFSKAVTVIAFMRHQKMMLIYAESPTNDLAKTLVDMECDFAAVLEGKAHLSFWDDRINKAVTFGVQAHPKCGLVLMA